MLLCVLDRLRVNFGDNWHRNGRQAPLDLLRGLAGSLIEAGTDEHVVRAHWAADAGLVRRRCSDNLATALAAKSACVAMSLKIVTVVPAWLFQAVIAVPAAFMLRFKRPETCIKRRERAKALDASNPNC